MAPKPLTVSAACVYSALPSVNQYPYTHCDCPPSNFWKHDGMSFLIPQGSGARLDQISKDARIRNYAKVSLQFSLRFSSSDIPQSSRIFRRTVLMLGAVLPTLHGTSHQFWLILTIPLGRRSWVH
jgi:hypothetical protein